MEKLAKTKYPILDVLTQRWTVRAFSDRLIEPQKLRRLFEAARWAPSSFNEQPWRFIIATKDQPEEFEKLMSCLLDKNQRWAKSGGVPFLMIALSKKTFTYDRRPNRAHIHDIGLALGNFVIQATAMDLHVCQLQGIHLRRVMELYRVPNDFEPTIGCAAGYAGDVNRLPEEFHERERRERTRADFKDFVFGGEFGTPAELFAK
jgi:nitroreductase